MLVIDDERCVALSLRDPLAYRLGRRLELINAYNISATPFVWVATAQSIIDKVARTAMRISGTAH